MYESETHEILLRRMLARVDDKFDKREGNLIYTCCSTVAQALADLYVDIDYTWDQISPLTADNDMLDGWGRTFSITRLPASPAELTAEIIMRDGFECPLGTRFNQETSQGGLNFVVLEKLETENQFLLVCEQSGEIGNTAYGTILPIESLPGLISARILYVAIPGEDQEDDDSLRQRIIDYFADKAFGGNIADYMQKLAKMPGVGAAKLIRYFENKDWNIGIYITSSEYTRASEELIAQVQEELLPILPNLSRPVIENSGDGLAPISHIPIVFSATEVPINITLNLEISTSTNFEELREPIEAAIKEYLIDCNKQWSREEYMYVRISHIENAVLAIDGVYDCYDTEINGKPENFRLQDNEITVMGEIIDGKAVH